MEDIIDGVVGAKVLAENPIPVEPPMALGQIR
jgi:hypothetical protein